MLRPGRWPLAALRRHARLFVTGVAGHADDLLVGLADELLANERVLAALLGEDGRDTQDIPGFAVLADRQHALVERMRHEPAQGIDGLVAKARGVVLRDPAIGYDGATALAVSLADDVLRLLIGSSQT